MRPRPKGAELMFDRDPKAMDFGVTCVENLFISEYLPAAKGEYVKVYLWGLFKSQHPDAHYGVREMAKELDMTVQQVESALRYWERRALVTLVSQEPEVYRFFSPLQRMHIGQLSDTADSDYVVFAESVYAAFGDQRKVTPSEVATVWEWVQDIGLAPEVVLMLINHCITLLRSHFSFKRAEKMAVLMKESHVLTVEDAELFLRNDMDIHKGAQDVLRHFGKRSRLPSEAELNLYRKWRTEWQFEHDAVLSACEETAKGEPTFAYLDGILKGIRSRGESRTGAQVQKQLQSEQNENELADEVMQALGLKATRAVSASLYKQWRKQMPHEVVLLAAQACSRTGGKAESMDQLLQAWLEKGLTDEEAVKAHLDRIRLVDTELKKVFEALAYRGKITAEDRALYEKWQSFGYGTDMMCAAASQSRDIDGHKIRYLDSVLGAWHEAGITDVAQALVAPRKDQKKPEKNNRRTVNAQQYGQRNYTEQDLAFGAQDLLKEAEQKNG